MISAADFDWVFDRKTQRDRPEPPVPQPRPVRPAPPCGPAREKQTASACQQVSLGRAVLQET